MMESLGEYIIGEIVEWDAIQLPFSMRREATFRATTR